MGSVRSRRGSEHEEINDDEFDQSDVSAIDSSFGVLSPSSSLSHDCLPESFMGTDCFPLKRRRLNFSPSQRREPLSEEEDEETKAPVKTNNHGVSPIDEGKWEILDLVSRDGKSKIRSEVLFASFDQRSEQAAGEAACAAVAVVMAHWLHTSPKVTPSKPEFDSLIIQGSFLWQSLCKNESYLRLFPDKHFDLETVVSANFRPIRVCSDKSFTGIFSPEKFDSLKGLMSFDDVWRGIEKSVECTGLEEPRVYILGWSDHFFVLKIDLDGYYIIDSFGERLFEGCKKAYILKFDDSSLIYDKKVLKKNPNPRSEDRTGDEEEEEEVVCRGKECCREYIKRFLAAIPVAQLAMIQEMGIPLDIVFLYESLQIDLHHVLVNK